MTAYVSIIVKTPMVLADPTKTRLAASNHAQILDDYPPPAFVLAIDATDQPAANLLTAPNFTMYWMIVTEDAFLLIDADSRYSILSSISGVIE
ncbi:MAG: hypothetical protein V3S33_06065 [Gammaproteobacteria bacterium]